jgi:hypothetical protein
LSGSDVQLYGYTSFSNKELSGLPEYLGWRGHPPAKGVSVSGTTIIANIQASGTWGLQVIVGAVWGFGGWDMLKE